MNNLQKTITRSNPTKNENIFHSKEYKKSRIFYNTQCTLEYFFELLVADAFLAKLLTYLGISDSLSGIISSFVSLAFIFQLLTIPLMKYMANKKKTVLIFDTLSQLMFMGLYLVPFFPVSVRFKAVLIVAFIIVGFFSKYLIYSVYFKWANSFVEPSKRGVFSALKETISLCCGIIFTLVFGFIIDKYESLGNLSGGFLFIAVSMFIINVFNFISILNIKNDIEKIESNKRLKKVFKTLWSNKNFRNITIMSVIWDVGRYMSIGFMGTFKINDLLLSVGIVQVINIFANVMRAVFSNPFGRYSDKTSFAKGFNLAFLIAAIGYFVNIFTSPGRIWCIVVFTVLYSVSLAGINQNSYNIVYSYVESDYIIQAMSVKNSLSGLLGFCSSLIGGKILNFIQSNGNTFMGFHIYGQQLLSLISLIIIVIAILFNKLVIQKQEIIRQ